VKRGEPSKSATIIVMSLQDSNAEIDWLALAEAARFRAREMARRLRISVRQLERCFSEEIGTTPHSWLNEARMWRAAHRLRGGSRPKEIVEELGFSDVSSMYHAFRSFHRCTPREYLATGRSFRESSGGIRELEVRNSRQPLDVLDLLQRAARGSSKLALYYIRGKQGCMLPLQPLK
jgi:AraC-like DNA-binding protein